MKFLLKTMVLLTAVQACAKDFVVDVVNNSAYPTYVSIREKNNKNTIFFNDMKPIASKARLQNINVGKVNKNKFVKATGGFVIDAYTQVSSLVDIPSTWQSSNFGLVITSTRLTGDDAKRYIDKALKSMHKGRANYNWYAAQKNKGYIDIPVLTFVSRSELK